MSIFKALSVVIAFGGILMIQGCSQKVVNDGLDVSAAAQRHIEAARAYIEERNTRKGLYHLQKAEEYEDKSFELFHTYALLYKMEGDAKQEEKYYKKALREDRNNPQVKNNYGSFLCFHDEPEDGVKLLRDATEDYSYMSRAEAYVNKGLCELEMDKIVDAEDSFQQALRLNTHSPRPLIELANIYLQKNDVRLAHMYYKQFANNVARQSPRTLWIGIQIANLNDDENSVSSYGLLLEKNFPESNENKSYQALIKNR